eukprot:10929080-Ditylum_brightwellii.AAC.1
MFANLGPYFNEDTYKAASFGATVKHLQKVLKSADDRGIEFKLQAFPNEGRVLKYDLNGTSSTILSSQSS